MAGGAPLRERAWPQPLPDQLRDIRCQPVRGLYKESRRSLEWPCGSVGGSARSCQAADPHMLPAVRKDLLEEYVNWIMEVCLFPLGYVL